ncbi:hypothetical protein [Streptomyces sp. NBC_00885]|uniref:hypothetical protein n=1 Tax=Streptomyces sp. NBC_00885 TaxID=2975857 RepID=UPI003870654C
MARVSEDGHGGHDVEASANGVAPAATATPMAEPQGSRNYSGVWVSRYEYFSSGRDSSFTGQHYVVVLQHGNRLTVRSLPGSSDSPLTMDFWR